MEEVIHVCVDQAAADHPHRLHFPELPQRPQVAAEVGLGGVCANQLDEFVGLGRSAPHFQNGLHLVPVPLGLQTDIGHLGDFSSHVGLEGGLLLEQFRDL